MKNKILITGSCGFILSNFLRKMVYDKKPYSLIGLDRLSQKDTNSIYYNKNCVFYLADVTDEHILDNIFRFEKPDIVIHGASGISENSIDIIKNNIKGTQTVIDACISHNVDKLIYLSNANVYGTTSHDIVFTEETSLNPQSVNAVSKVSSELLIKAASKQHGLKYNILRAAKTYGPRQPKRQFFTNALKSIMQEENLLIDDYGLRVQDWLHVFDHCAAIMTLIESGKDNEIYNVSANQEFSNVEVIQRICKILEKDVNLVSFSNNDLHHEKRIISSKKIMDLGWSPSYKFKDGLVGTIDWFSNNFWFLK